MIQVRDLSVQVGGFRLERVSFTLPTGEYGALMGKTGSGKTTILECICGLRALAHGRIELDGEDVTTLRPGEREIGYVPQDGVLFPKLTVRGNLALPLVIRKQSTAAIDDRVEQLATELEIREFLDRRPDELSGGERQRVAIGRALAARPQVLLLDEPLSALDDDTRARLRDVLQRFKQAESVTTLHVTHSQADAGELADRVFQLREGRVEIPTTAGVKAVVEPR